MSEDKRIFRYLSVDFDTIRSLFFQYDSSIKISSVNPIKSGMSTSNFKIDTDTKKYLLKVYPENNDHSDMEMAMYQYAKAFINVPALLFCDQSRRLFHSAYAIFEYVISDNLGEFIKAHNDASEHVVYKIGQMLALLHKKTYQNPGTLAKDLSVAEVIRPINKEYEKLLSEKAGTHLSLSCKNLILDFINKKPTVLKRMAENNVLSHGDFNFSNILIDHDTVPWFIDFEYAFSCSVYYDIGKFFRTKEPSVQACITDKLRKRFYEGYNAQTETSYPRTGICCLSLPIS